LVGKTISPTKINKKSRERMFKDYMD
jgi:hypothetical protein